VAASAARFTVEAAGFVPAVEKTRYGEAERLKSSKWSQSQVVTRLRLCFCAWAASRNLSLACHQVLSPAF
jgi:hypothetical protein